MLNTVRPVLNSWSLGTFRHFLFIIKFCRSFPRMLCQGSELAFGQRVRSGGYYWSRLRYYLGPNYFLRRAGRPDLRRRLHGESRRWGKYFTVESDTSMEEGHNCKTQCFKGITFGLKILALLEFWFLRSRINILAFFYQVQYLHIKVGFQQEICIESSPCA